MSNKDEIFRFWKENGNGSLDNFTNLKNSEFVPFVGAGMSVAFGYQTWYDFIKGIIDYFPENDRKEFAPMLENNNLLATAEAINEYLNNGITEMVLRDFSPHKRTKPSNNYIHLLDKMGISKFITTNYDSVIEDNYSKINVLLPNSCDNVLELERTGKPFILKLHGSINELNSIILTETQYKKHYASPDGDISQIIKYFWSTKTLLFLGCGLQKDYLVERMYALANKKVKSWHYAILERPETLQEARAREIQLIRLKILPIWYPSGQHEAVYTILSMLSEEKKKFVQKEPSDTLFNQDITGYFDDYVDMAAKVAFSKGTYNELAQAILMQSQHTHGHGQKTLKNLLSQINRLSEQELLEIRGEPGTGKSTLMSILYLKTLETLNNVYSVLVDLHYYDGKEMEFSLKHLKENLQRIDDVISSHQIIIFMDGLNEYKRKNYDLEIELAAHISKWRTNKNAYFVYSMGIMPENYFPPFTRDLRIRNLLNSRYKIVLQPIDVNGKELNALLKKIFKFYNIQPVINRNEKEQAKFDALYDNFRNCCKRAAGNYIELRTVNFLAKAYLYHGDAMFKQPIGEIFLQHYLGELNEEKLLETAEYAANFMLNHHNHIFPSTYYMIYKSPTMRDFLFAYYYVESIKKEKMENLEIFDCIFTPCINRFVTDFITKNAGTEDKVVAQIISYFPNLSLQQRNQAVYLIGRVKSVKVKERVNDFLHNQYAEELARFNEVRKDKDQIMYFRTLGISLLYLGNFRYENDFYQKLLYDPRVRELNRNFHMEYYTSENYMVGNIMSFEGGDSEAKIRKLYDFLYHGLKRVKCVNLKCINIITLLNLAIHNKYNKKNGHFFDGFVELLENLRDDTSITNQIVKDYIIDVSQYILSDNVYATTFEQIYNLKRIQREGWKREGREIDRYERPESVADHTWACCQLAQVLLSEKIEYCDFIDTNDAQKYEHEYNKEHIILLLLVHDLPEIHIGDLTPGQKTEEDRELEQKSIHAMRVLDSFPFFHSFEKTEHLWNEYMDGKTFNSQIAYDIDKLEPLVQLYIYRKMLPANEALNVKNEWLQYVNMRLKTQFGRKVLSFIKEYLLGKDFEK